MIIWLVKTFSPLLEQLEVLSTGDSRVFLTARMALASLSSFLIAILLGPLAIRWLEKRFRERVDSDSEKLNEIHASKNATPTMGGIFIVGSILISGLLWADLSNRYVQLGLLTAAGFALLGAYDDWIKLSTTRNGLKPRQKLLVQLIFSCVIGTVLYFDHNKVPSGLDLIMPVTRMVCYLGLFFIPWSMFVMTGSSNAVNLTDGLDGLASGCMVFAGSAFAGLTYLAGHKVMAEYLQVPFIPGAGELSILLGATVGAVLGFLWFNCYPAQVFMGDTGSLPLGALLGFSALVIRQEALLVIAGGVFVVETLSVIIQVFWYRRTGVRVLACSPLHNHYLFKGQHEMKIVVRFWICSALLAIIAISSLKIAT
ncbi:phospho-N-acetylmuramoyl-pentapeptide-transferase [Gimesia maris]|uniref:Phospho-N-acetylmuramoyl-pentapeptide-transferase n=1 Tax=Gimesia maris TaxID=122 RepID=A0ABX5YLU9_9PLAN|nr:phospho-N-acetylmuramoyl-pentapeptide-transferase [Gimesia maris]EDL57523.1 Phospho-N-acetylmuramoyl-pentapeptide transferase [Gimesia maris DSM 8797]QDU14608.1 Phospho-N-acetylmuramoyl-pentapeptide-transferase MraY [Gimesia maris]QEG16587.1 Phospho-N-acetylmuramoyl-pentapeptide-transferase MraY [Gimesia maris]QGQ30243.1 phospho-N-acetylmuramoyl-pentapeptide-transferase [Gimesia maris]|tara:strand:- start:1440 stop:2546 length:1107 start_codon:yes stop_codon:yes gene_type:complete